MLEDSGPAVQPGGNRCDHDPAAAARWLEPPGIALAFARRSPAEQRPPCLRPALSPALAAAEVARGADVISFGEVLAARCTFGHAFPTRRPGAARPASRSPPLAARRPRTALPAFAERLTLRPRRRGGCVVPVARGAGVIDFEEPPAARRTLAQPVAPRPK